MWLETTNLESERLARWNRSPAEAARANMPSANHYLGRFYYQGIGVNADPKMALVHYQAAADGGHAISQLTVADFHAYGEAGPVKIDLALRYPVV